jgi:bacitracin synthase 3
MKQYLQNYLPEYMIPVYIIQLKMFPVTKNGKLDRKALPDPEIVDIDNYLAPENEAERIVSRIFEEILGIEKVGLQDSFLGLGGDSIKAIRIISRIREKGYEASVKDIMHSKTVKTLSAAIKKTCKKINQEEVIGEVAFTPIQKHFWESSFTKPEHFNQSILLSTRMRIQEKLIHIVIDHIVSHHDILRCIFKEQKQTILSNKESSKYELLSFDLKGNNDESIMNEIDMIASPIQADIDLANGPLLKILLLHTSASDYLLFIAHHLIIDGVSWRILVEDINNAYLDILSERKISLPAKTSSYKEWSNELIEYSKSFILHQEICYWKNINNRILTCNLQRKEANIYGKAVNESLFLPTETTKKLLYSYNHIFSTESNDLLLTVVSKAIQEVTGKNAVAYNMESHGRESINQDIEVDRTVGWFTNIYPVIIEGLGSDIGQDILTVKETLRHIPQKGIGYGVLAYISNELKNISSEFTYNYLGEMDEEVKDDIFKIIKYGSNVDVAEENNSLLSLDINIMIVEKQLLIHLTYNNALYTADMIDLMKEKILFNIERIIDYLQDRNHLIILSPTDVGEFDWTLEEFKKVESRMAKNGYQIDRIYPLTSMQEGMLYHKLLDDKSSEYVVLNSFSTKEINYEAFERSLQLIGDKHRVLHTAIIYKEVKTPRQIILRNRSIECNLIDLRNEDNPIDIYELKKQEDYLRGFDLEIDSLLRVTLFRLENETRVLLCFHHIIMDGWCLPILLNDLATIYTGILSDNKNGVNLYNEDAPYENYVRAIIRKDTEKGLKYWRDLLVDYNNAASIPVSRARVNDWNENKSCTVTLELSQSIKIEKFAQESNVTVNTIFETVWGILLQKYNNIDDVVFGKVVSGRNIDIKDIDKMLGLFINTIPVRVRCEKDQEFLALLQTVQEQAFESEQYDYCALPEIQKQSKVGNQLLPTLIDFANYYVSDSLEEDALKLTEIQGDSHENTNYDITLTIVKNETYTFSILYNTSLYSQTDIERLLSRFTKMIEQIL